METLELLPTKNTVSGRVQIGGSKSYTNRSLILSALADGKSRLTSISLGQDSKVLIRSLQKLGIPISLIDQTTVDVEGCGGKLRKQNTTLDIGHAGTAMRFLTALCCLVPGETLLDGSPRMRERPIKDLVVALGDLGISIKYVRNEGFPPLRILGGTRMKSSVLMSGKISSQFITALLLIAPVLPRGLQINICDEQISKSYIDMTIDSLKAFGVNVVNANYRNYFVNQQQKLKPTDYQVEGDASNASYLFAMAAVSGGTMTVSNVNPYSSQGDIHFVDVLEKMGCVVSKDNKNKAITITGPTRLKAVSVDMCLMPDTAQTLAVVAAFADGTTHIGGLSTLRIKESDRIEATKNELSKMGIHCESTRDSLSVCGAMPRGATIETYDDHRMALAFSVAGAVVNGVRIISPSVVDKSFPGYWETLKKIGIYSK